ncbi:AraC family transcriptional regulator [Pseudomaricurvus alkylphenolicus]|uniref:AraC family transcriptional regulator ligand-binding domain-containing protein n=1 Tax=Pseudomaricurvus alkylphenolicus TaxID=1306991 RepID=UPI001423859C|nr:AraC family transcriptional regulator [Pseudomaricurvus alkylphenolicus]
MPTIFSEKLFQRFEDQFRPFIDKLDIPATIFSCPDVEISGAKYLELLEAVARNTNPFIGLDMGEGLAAQDMGVLGHAMASAVTIGEALAIMSRYLYVFAQSNTIRLDIAGGKAVCTYTVKILHPGLHRQDAELAVAYITHLIRDLSKREFHPDFVEFEHSSLGDTKRYWQQFGCEVKFERRANRIQFDKKVLDYPVVSADSRLLEALTFYLDDRLKVRSDDKDLLAKTRHLIAISLSSGAPDLKKLATQMGMSSRSLQRKLGDKDIVFSELVDSIRSSIAMDYVYHTEYSLTDVALMLGYSELSTFSRAFKRWSGISPLQARESRDDAQLQG